MTDAFDAFHLSASPGDDPDEWLVREAAGARWRVPRMRPGLLADIAVRLRDQRYDVLLNRPVASIIDAIDAAAARLADPDDPLRRAADALLPAVTGYARPMIDRILDRMLADWRAPALRRLLDAELRDPAALDRFVADPVRGSRVHAAGPELVVHVLAGNVPGVAVTSLIRALLVKSASLAKTGRREPILAPLFARALQQVDPDLAACIAVTWWPGADTGLTRAALRAADAVLVYGGDAAVNAARAHARPEAVVLEHGPRVSFGFVAREALASDALAARTAADVAEATALFDQQGCVSPQLVYVEQGGALDARAFARLAAAALDSLRDRLPRATLSPDEAAAIHRIRASTEFRAIGGHDVDVFGSLDTAATVLYEADPAFAGSPLNRVLRVKPLADLDDLPARLRPVGRLLQTAGFAGPPDRIAALAPRLTAAGVTRIAPFRDMPFPPPFWHHDGRGPLAELLRWTDLEIG